MPPLNLCSISAWHLIGVNRITALHVAFASIVRRELVDDVAKRRLVGITPPSCRSMRDLDLFVCEVSHG
tara:strand:+ start:2908 stop:3114 length:207 start_codon:yes stop_codon:yes gene_type:complete